MRFLFGSMVVVGAVWASGCGRSGSVAGAVASPPPVKVSYVEVHPEDVSVDSEYAAETFARDAVDIRGRVDGFIEKRFFQVGADVRSGDPLYLLDTRPYEADVARAKADVAQAEANLEFARRQVALVQAEADLAQANANLLKAKQDVDRLIPLVKEDAASQQDLDNANAAYQANLANTNAKKANVEQTRLSTQAQIDTSAATVDARKAALRTAELNLEYASIRSPIDGRVGDTTVQVGGLVNHASAVPLTTVVPLDPIWVRFKVSEAEHLEFERRADRDQARQRPFRLVIADGTELYPGKFQNTTNQVDSKTGTLEVQATFPNPEHRILPGQFGRVRLSINDKSNVLLVPQKAVQDLQGTQSVLSIGEGNKVIARTVVTGDRVGERWIILQGLKEGDKVIVDGLQKARPGAVVTPELAKPEVKDGRK